MPGLARVGRRPDAGIVRLALAEEIVQLQAVQLGSKDEVVVRKPVTCVCPQLNTDIIVRLQVQIGVMPLFLCNLSHTLEQL